MNRGQSFSGAGSKVSSSSGDYASQNLGIHEDLMGNVFVKDLAVIPVSTPEVCASVRDQLFGPAASATTHTVPLVCTVLNVRCCMLLAV
jgi:hypothetical protein